ncbi:hypothetical protein [Glaciimonas immobilis]|uniref:Uncharacterized protein n=1 Tax=Glaciimonas immobilis TaxID=728004 RepID=A0A840RZU0_9BURK|nr:hypothetical protein [Glaciimonas immobilis]KAF3998257.1 hypothetical protein HAV38_08600 [Glaciimonas immobilis]MBB5201869.1 hypothetical protein [Glaciimonas immobilis]
MSSIKLTFYNKSQDVKNNNIVMFQKNTGASVNESVIAWKVIENCGIGDFNPFDYPLTQQVSVIDLWGNYSPLQDANNGDVFSVTDAKGLTGTILSKTREIGDPNMVTVRNDLAIGSIDIAIYKDSRQLSLKSGVTPGDESLFELLPYLFIGTCVDVVEGDVMDSDTVQGSLTKLSLLGLKSADISMTGGGTGQLATAFVFTLDSQKYC